MSLQGGLLPTLTLLVNKLNMDSLSVDTPKAALGWLDCAGVFYKANRI
jgi:hypothetical protein